jgi:hypothetical protein
LASTLTLLDTENNEKAMGFKPGQSGNPGGRPKKAYDIQALAQALTDQALDALVAALECPGERVQAAKVILERGYGKPLQPVDMMNVATNPTSALTDEELTALILAETATLAVDEAELGRDTADSDGIVHERPEQASISSGPRC